MRGTFAYWLRSSALTIRQGHSQDGHNVGRLEGDLVLVSDLLVAVDGRLGNAVELLAGEEQRALLLVEGAAEVDLEVGELGVQLQELLTLLGLEGETEAAAVAEDALKETLLLVVELLAVREDVVLDVLQRLVDVLTRALLKAELGRLLLSFDRAVSDGVVGVYMLKEEGRRVNPAVVTASKDLRANAGLKGALMRCQSDESVGLLLVAGADLVDRLGDLLWRVRPVGRADGRLGV